MEKLELKNIVGYLPYGLKIQNNGYQCKQISTLVGIKEDSVIYETKMTNITSINKDDIEQIKPILRPLSDLTKEIDDIIVYDSLSKRSRMDFENLCPNILKWSYEDVEILLKHHFDIYGLIEKGFAIDINTLDNGIQ